MVEGLEKFSEGNMTLILCFTIHVRTFCIYFETSLERFCKSYVHVYRFLNYFLKSSVGINLPSLVNLLVFTWIVWSKGYSIFIFKISQIN